MLRNRGDRDKPPGLEYPSNTDVVSGCEALTLFLTVAASPSSSHFFFSLTLLSLSLSLSISSISKSGSRWVCVSVCDSSSQCLSAYNMFFFLCSVGRLWELLEPVSLGRRCKACLWAGLFFFIYLSLWKEDAYCFQWCALWRLVCI